MVSASSPTCVNPSILCCRTISAWFTNKCSHFAVVLPLEDQLYMSTCSWRSIYPWCSPVWNGFLLSLLLWLLRLDSCMPAKPVRGNFPEYTPLIPYFLDFEHTVLNNPPLGSWHSIFIIFTPYYYLSSLPTVFPSADR